MSSNINFSNKEELIDFFYANSINYFNSHKKTKIFVFLFDFSNNPIHFYDLKSEIQVLYRIK